MVDYMKEVFFCFMCSKCKQTDDCEERRLEDAIKVMREQGWKIGKEKNTCPNCQEVSNV